MRVLIVGDGTGPQLKALVGLAARLQADGEQVVFISSVSGGALAKRAGVMPLTFGETSGVGWTRAASRGERERLNVLSQFHGRYSKPLFSALAKVLARFVPEVLLVQEGLYLERSLELSLDCPVVSLRLEPWDAPVSGAPSAAHLRLAWQLARREFAANSMGILAAIDEAAASMESYKPVSAEPLSQTCAALKLRPALQLFEARAGDAMSHSLPLVSLSDAESAAAALTQSLAAVSPCHHEQSAALMRLSDQPLSKQEQLLHVARLLLASPDIDVAMLNESVDEFVAAYAAAESYYASV